MLGRKRVLCIRAGDLLGRAGHLLYCAATRAADILLADIDALLRALKNRAMEHNDAIGRSHAIHAEPTTFGLKMAQAYAD